MCQQQFLEVYLEGTRSRSGKPSTARAGMLSLVVDTLSTGAVADVLVVPVGISYDRIIEGNYNSEQLVSALISLNNPTLWLCGIRDAKEKILSALYVERYLCFIAVDVTT